MKISNKLTHNLSILLIFLFVFMLSFPGGLAGGAGSGNGHAHALFTAAEIHPDVMELLAGDDEPVEALIILKERADTEKIAESVKRYIRPFATGDQEKLITRRTVVSALKNVADRTQEPLLNYLKLEKIRGKVAEFKNFYIVNVIYVKASPRIIRALAWNHAVEKILPNSTFELQQQDEEDPITPSYTEPASATAEWGVRRIEADKVWNEFDITGEGVVIGVMDTGAVWQHPALKEKWRGYNPADPDNPDPVYNWFDPVYGRDMPRDIHTTSGGYHGTHVTGTIVGSVGNNLIGVAPGAQWIAANIFKTDITASNVLIIEAGEYMLAPTDENGLPNPDMAPDIINCSWGAPASSSKNQYEDEQLREMVQNWRAAGILPVIAAANYGPSSGTIGVPAMYPESFAVAATTSSNAIYSKSARGPVSYYPDEIKPNISAPGVSIRSSMSTSSYGTKDGTSMATPHVSGTAALLLSLDPDLTVDELEKIMTDTAINMPDATSSPNNTFGHGLVNAYKAVESVIFDVVYITDNNLEEAIRENINKPEDSITRDDMKSITNLEASSLAIKSLNGLEYAVNLEILDLSDNAISDISQLAGLKKLTNLDLSKNLTDDISPLVTNSNNGGLGKGDEVNVRYNRLDLSSGSQAANNILLLRENEVEVIFDLQVLPTIFRPEWTGPGIIEWEEANNAAAYEVILYKNRETVDTQTADSDEIQHDFSAKMRNNGTGNYTATVQAKGDGDLYSDGDTSSHSPVYLRFKLDQVKKPVWNNSIITWEPVDGAGTYRVKLYKDQEPFRTITLSIPGISSHDFTATISGEEEHGIYTATVQALGDGIIYSDGSVSHASEPLDPDNPTPDPDPYEKAVAAVESLFDGDKLAEGVTEDDIDNALALVDALEDGPDKDELMSKVVSAYELLDPHVHVPVSGVSLAKNTLLLVKGESALLLPTVSPDNATNKNVSWSSNDVSVATVNRFGEVSAKSEGTATITVVTEDGGYEATCMVEVKQTGEVLKIILTDPADLNPEVPVNKVIRVRFDKDIHPSDNYDNITLKYDDNTEHLIKEKEIDGQVLFIEPKGNLKYNKVYTITLPAGIVTDIDNNPNKEYGFSFGTVMEPDAPIAIDRISLNTGEFGDLTLMAGGSTATLVPIVEPENATDWGITWTSSEESVAIVTKNLAGDGIITPRATGTTTITATVKQGNDAYFTAHCKVKVIKYGDITGSGSVDVSDAIMLLRKVVGLAELTELQQEAGRVAGQSGITVSDAILVLRFIVGLIDEFPVQAV